jgi:protein ImuB
MPRTACVWCPDWPVVTARRRDPRLAGAAVAIMARGARGARVPVVYAASAEARALGVRSGLRQREAEALAGELVVLDTDGLGDARAFEPVVRAVEQLSPRLVLERPGRLWFPTRGPSRYFGGDVALAARVREVIEAMGVPDVRVGIADTELAAALAARARASGLASSAVVAPGAAAAFLATRSVMTLAGRIEGGTELVGLMTRLGIRTLGALAALPAGAVLARFGPSGAHAHRLASGVDEPASSSSVPSPELAETVELDPPAGRVDEVVFVAKGLADRLLTRLERLGLMCTRVVVEAETEHGERLVRCWRHEGALTPDTLVTRVRWQLEVWLTRREGSAPAQDGESHDVPTGALSRLRLVPDDVVPAVGRQLGFWGGDARAEDRAAHALARVQGMLGYDSVTTPVPRGGRTPAEQARWVPWGEPRPADDRTAPWPGSVPGPRPARVFAPPLAAELLDGDDRPIGVTARGEATGVPATLCCPSLTGGRGRIVAWAGPWASDVRWWDRRRRCALWQVVAATRG